MGKLLKGGSIAGSGSSCTASSTRSGTSSPIINEKGEEQYVVEKIMEKRVLKNGRVQYLIKWEGYDHSENSWQFKEECACEDLIEDFEADWEAEEARKRRERINQKMVQSKNRLLRILDKNFTDDPIVNIEGVRPMAGNVENINGSVKYEAYVRYNSGYKEMVPTEILAEHAPMLLIKFYEARLKYQNAVSNKSTLS